MGTLKFRAGILFALAMFTSSCLGVPASDLLNVSQSESQPDFTVPDGTLVVLNEQVRMRDGVRLNTDVYVPGGGKSPVATILIRTPYASELGARHQTLLERGYVIVEQHERGRYLSEGEFSMIPKPVEDG
jgi:predicted acyl esterase